MNKNLIPEGCGLMVERNEMGRQAISRLNRNRTVWRLFTQKHRSTMTRKASPTERTQELEIERLTRLIEALKQQIYHYSVSPEVAALQIATAEQQANNGDDDGKD